MDGTSTDWSFLSAVKGEKPKVLTEFKEACRTAVRGDILAAKRRFFEQFANEDGKVECELTGVMVGFDEAHVDHKIPFNLLVENWIDALELVIKPELLTAPADNQFVAAFADKELERKFLQFHRKFCNGKKNLRLVAIKPNLRMSAEAKITSSKRPLFLLDE